MNRSASMLLAIALVVLCAFTTSKGLEILRFLHLSAQVETLVATGDGAARHPEPEWNAAKRELQRWIEIPGIRWLARSDTLALKASTRRGLFDSEPEVVSMLSVRPMSGKDWVLLARIRLLNGIAVNRIVSAFDMAILVAPHEPAIMPERLDLGLRIWESLSPRARERIAMDFALVGPPHPAPDTERIRSILSSKSESVQADIRERVLRYADEKKGSLKKFGL